MTKTDPLNHNLTAEINSGLILLLADDGRMTQMLRKCPENLKYRIESSVLAGMASLGSESFRTILLCVERLRGKTTEVVKALRSVAPQSKIILYGEPFAEVYAQPALRAGADDYLIWPIPRRELMHWISPPGPISPAPTTDPQAQPRRHQPNLNRVEGEKNSPFSPDTIETDNTYALDKFHELAQLIPQGSAALIDHAEKILAEIFHLPWVKIELPHSSAEPSENTCQSNSNLTGLTVDLPTPQAVIGQMILAPAKSQPSLQSIQPLAAFLATLLNLCQRDESLKHLAIVDELTGAYNRRYLEHFLQQVIQQSHHQHTELTLLLFDIDEFKHYNDTYGHAAGDEILRQTTTLIRRCCREHDVVARIGGDEFAVLFWDTGKQRVPFSHDENTDQIPVTQPNNSPRTHPEMVVFLSNRIRRLMQTNEFPSLGPEARGVLTISGGLAAFPDDGTDLKDLHARADEALLHAKRSGKNRIYLVGQPNSKPQE